MIADGVLARSLRGLRPGSRARGRAPSGARGRRGARRGLRTTWRLWLLVGVLAAAALVGGGWLWVRDSGLVAVERVTVTGLSGPDADQIRSSLVAAARGMTTLDVRLGTLHAAVSPYPVVAGLHVSTQLPHGMRITVLERLPVAEVTLGGQAIPVAADGTLLRDVQAAGRLPVLTLKAAPGGTRLADGASLDELRALAAAPAGLRSRVASASSDYWHGVVLQIRQGPVIYFGAGGAAPAKWRAVLDLLATPADAGASYLDVTDPIRPSAGVGGTETSLANAVASAAGTTTTAAGGSASTGG